jgi:hypothetical protein
MSLIVSTLTSIPLGIWDCYDCIIHSANCIDCPYGKTNGKCINEKTKNLNKKSSYGKITTSVQNLIDVIKKEYPIKKR